MIRIKNVLVATDFSVPSASALTYGREFARMFGARLHVLHVVENSMMAAGPDAIAADIGRLQADLDARARNGLEQIVTAEDREQLNAVPVLRMGHSTAFEIARYAEEAAVDMILMGTHGRGALGHLLMGSVAEKVVRIAPCPVLTVRHPQHEFIQADELQTISVAKR